MNLLMKTRALPAALLSLGLAAGLSPVFAQAPTYDVLIRGGRIVDGTGNPWFDADVAVKDGKVAAVGRLGNVTATRVIDATGLVVAPGFIDLHTHTDLLGSPDAQSKLREGVTLDVMGESDSVAPRRPGQRERSGPTWTTFTEYFDLLRKQGFSMNIISHAAYGSVRSYVMGGDEGPASPAQIEEMKKVMAQAMQQGAWGLVTRFESGGPEYPNEVIELAKVASAYGGNYTSHIGSEGYQQEKELAFVARVSEEANISTHVFHFKIRAKNNWGTIGNYIQQIDGYRARGLDVTANQYPYTAMFHGWSAFFPTWMRSGGNAKFTERLRDLSLRDKLKSDPDFKTWSEEHGGWDGIVLARAYTDGNKKYEGMRISEIAKARGDADPADTCINLMAEESGRISGIFHTMSEEDVQKAMKEPWVAIASDGSAIDLTAPGVPHPRNYSTNVRVLGHYVREEHVLTLEDAVRKMTSLPAQILGLSDRGQIHEGFAADLALFDPETVTETNSFENPKSYAKGVPYVLVNGVLVIDKGEHTGARPGQVVLGHGYKAQ